MEALPVVAGGVALGRPTRAPVQGRLALVITDERTRPTPCLAVEIVPSKGGTQRGNKQTTFETLETFEQLKYLNIPPVFCTRGVSRGVAKN